MCSDETADRVWRQVQSGVLDLSALEVTTVGMDDPDRALDAAKNTRGLSIVALAP
jgi:alcohol dehydrogenase